VYNVSITGGIQMEREIYQPSAGEYASNYIVCSLCTTCKRFEINPPQISADKFRCRANFAKTAAKISWDNNYQVQDVCSFFEGKETMNSNSQNSTKKAVTSKGSVLGLILGILAVIVMGIKGFIETTGIIGVFVFLIVIGFTIFKIVKERKYLFNIFNCIWIMFCVYMFFEINKGSPDILVFSISFIVIIAVIPLIINLIVRRIKKSK
jgi:hypothetical protein